MIDLLVTLFYFVLFVVVIIFFARRYLPVLQKADDEERKNYRQLVGYRAGLKKQLDREHVVMHQQDFVYASLSENVEQWQMKFKEQQQREAHERAVRQQALLRTAQEQMRVVQERQMEEKLVPEVFAQAREQLFAQFQNPVAEKAAESYLQQAIKTVQSEK